MRRFSLRNTGKTKAPVFIGLLLCFLIILSFPTLFGSLMFGQVNQMINEQTVDSALFMLRQSTIIVDRFLESVDTTVNMLAVDRVMLSAALLRRPAFASKDIVFFIPIADRIKMYTVSPIIDSKMVVVFKRSDAVAQRGGLIFGVENYYQNSMKYVDLSYDKWKASTLDRGERQVFLPSMKVTSKIVGNEDFVCEYVTYIHNLPMLSFITLIRSDTLGALLTELIVKEPGAAFVTDSQQNILVGIGDQQLLEAVDLSQLSDDNSSFTQLINGETMLVLSRHSDVSALRYISINPLSAVLSNPMRMQRAMLLGMAITLMLGISLSYMFSKRYTRSIAEIISMMGNNLSSREKAISYFNAIKRHITELTSSNIHMSEAIEQQIVISRSLFLGQLLSGVIHDQRELDKYLEYFRMNFGCELIAVLCIDRVLSAGIESVEIGDIFEGDLFKLYVDQIVQTLSITGAYSVLRENKEIAIIICLDAKDSLSAKQQCESIASELQRRLEHTNGIRTAIGIGNVYQQLLDVHASHSEAREALFAAQLLDRGHVVSYDSMYEKARIGYYYPLEVEYKIVTLAKAGNKDALFAILNRIIDENRTSRTISKSARIQFYNELRATLIKTLDEVKGIAHDLNSSDIVFADLSVMPPEDVIRLIGDGFSDICDRVEQRRKSHNQALIDDILSAIAQRYTSSDLGVDTLAYQFHISPAYFSRYFKEQTGVVFSAYLERMRIDKARDLLEHTDWPMERISGHVGYNSVYSFRRAFKKTTGTNPAEYRLSCS
ncbi:hypothetical protein FACS1894184_02450 [Clostridia bacterium]|nr:hypothetical protein FACS1894184_02450 [Clostridia bacterium]